MGDRAGGGRGRGGGRSAVGAQVAGAIVISDRLEALVTAGAKVSMGFFAAEGR